ncbi:hypothetical protein CALCODRAFT_285377 [Calocera cornea HHB12733]|uniref:Uncharacterized protein n=1 Tax=Calocera cornea HHB12733 TaxID=1353952 RepID=A0A165FZT2_9BASI|nr:hypothetical protein CALCODRAFT_285377 [Calocera cornea HHB12733]
MYARHARRCHSNSLPRPVKFASTRRANAASLPPRPPHPSTAGSLRLARWTPTGCRLRALLPPHSMRAPQPSRCGGRRSRSVARPAAHSRTARHGTARVRSCSSAPYDEYEPSSAPPASNLRGAAQPTGNASQRVPRPRPPLPLLAEQPTPSSFDVRDARQPRWGRGRADARSVRPPALLQAAKSVRRPPCEAGYTHGSGGTASSSAAL